MKYLIILSLFLTGCLKEDTTPKKYNFKYGQKVLVRDRGNYYPDKCLYMEEKITETLFVFCEYWNNNYGTYCQQFDIEKKVEVIISEECKDKQ